MAIPTVLVTERLTLYSYEPAYSVIKTGDTKKTTSGTVRFGGSRDYIIYDLISSDYTPSRFYMLFQDVALVEYSSVNCVIIHGKYNGITLKFLFESSQLCDEFYQRIVSVFEEART